MTEGKRLHTVTEVAKVLGVNRNRVYQLIHHGHIQALKLGSLKVPTFEIDDFMKINIGKDFTYLEDVKELKF